MSKATQQIPDNSFLHALTNYRRGELLGDLSDALRRVNEAVSECKKAGQIILKIKVSPSGEAYSYLPEVSVKLPLPDKPAAIFFMDDNYNLTRENPNQQNLDLRAVDGGVDEGKPLKEAQ